jgi:predicted RND superfamily exporter protein
VNGGVLKNETKDSHRDPFDPQSGSLVERLLFNHRTWVLFICALVTFLLAIQAVRLPISAEFDKTLPSEHAFIKNYRAHKEDLKALGNSLRLVVEAPSGETIYSAGYLEALQHISDEVFLLPGVDRPFMKSLWTPNTRWVGVTEEGLEGGPVIPDNYDGSPSTLKSVQHNVQRSGELGQLVALDGRSSIIFVPLLDKDGQSGRPLDYAKLSAALDGIRIKYAQKGVTIHITGFAKVIGDLMAGMSAVMSFFLVACIIACALLYRYTRCVRSTLLVVTCSMTAVVWQLGVLAWFGRALDPYSVLVPFLVFAIGISHGAQKMNGITQDIGRGANRTVAARYTFRRLFLAGLTALLCDAVGFAVLSAIRIPTIQDLALAASVGVFVLIFTNLVLLPVLLSLTGVSARAAQRSLAFEREGAHPGWQRVARFAGWRWAVLSLVVCTGLGAVGLIVSQRLAVGDVNPGAPELRTGSRYNRDAAYVNRHYETGSDVFAVMVQTAPGHCADYDVLAQVDALESNLQRLPGVTATSSLAGFARKLSVAMNEGNPKWYDLVRNQAMLNTFATQLPRGMMNEGCDLLVLSTYLADHKADTLKRVVDTVDAFAVQHATPEANYLLAAGNAGFEAATNIVVDRARHEMLFWVYGAVTLLCLITFRSWRAVICAVVPLMLTSVLCEALMVLLGISVKVATLPVIALGVGIGVDYALYIMSILLAEMRRGSSLSVAYYRALLTTGRVVVLTGVTLSAGVATWIFSPIKFQADMGLLLAFMFLWNMLGALFLLPALARFLLRPSVQQTSDTCCAQTGSAA